MSDSDIAALEVESRKHFETFRNTKVSLPAMTAVMLATSLFSYALGVHEWDGEGFDSDVVAANFENTEFDRFAYLDELDAHVAEAGETLIYFPSGERFAFVGDVIDLEERVNLTERRRAELRSFGKIEADLLGKPAAAVPAPAAPSERAAPRPERPQPPVLVDVSDIPEGNLVVHNPGAGEVVYVVTDYNCPYCHRLHETLKAMGGLEIREIPVGLLSQESSLKAASALCDDDPASVAAGYYAGAASKLITTCTEGEAAVDANSGFMRANNISGTPFLIRPDGQWLSGARPAADIQALLGSAT